MNRYVLATFLKVSKLTHVCTLSGSWFHLVGPYVLKVLLVNPFLFAVGTCSRLYLVLDLSPFLPCPFLTISSCRYFGVWLLSYLNTGKSILKSILYCIGNICNSLRHSVALSLDFLFKMILLQCFVYIALHLLTFGQACRHEIAIT